MRPFLPIFAVLLATSAAAAPIGLSELARRCQGACAYAAGGKEGTVTGKNFQLTCRQNSAAYRLDGVHVYGQHPTGGEAGRLTVDGDDWMHVFMPLLSPPAVPAVRRVCIDAGHGGKDSGSVHRGGALVEKNLTLAIALRLKELLEKRHISVVLSRENDRFVALDDRPALANAADCDLFISIHFNAADSPAADGVETYLMPPRGMPSTARLGRPTEQDRRIYPNNRCDERNIWLAYCLQKQLASLPGTKDRGVRWGRFQVLKTARCPAALVECGFLTSEGEGKRIGTAEHREAIARALCEGICHYGRR
jgi:N-acetylmuramoyl-L-alanine amidase